MEVALRDDLKEAAGNLLAELYDVRDEYKRGRIDADTFLKRVKVIRGRGKRFVAWAPTQNPVQPSLFAAEGR
jgi:hypothetical protein